MGVGRPSKASTDELRRVDLLWPTAFATSARAAGVRHFGLLTTLGADKDAKPGGFLSFFETNAGGGLWRSYKGQLESNVEELKFESAAALRPATLIGTPNTPAVVAWLSSKVDGLLPLKLKEHRGCCHGASGRATSRNAPRGGFNFSGL
mmetsp:Transcript_149104/g.477542  ORF Transcript_149104/g.477542 Transcript_149104/m.477542 type:complete len:149 (+) Transcript_149104:229-675(+)